MVSVMGNNHPDDFTSHDVIGPRIDFFPHGIELFLESEGVWGGEHALLFGDGFLFVFVRLILLLPLFTSAG
jgi:hypothetical protein